ncbi:hypothetical protein MOUN0_B00144 [Monosporozyma unispora]
MMGLQFVWVRLCAWLLVYGSCILSLWKCRSRNGPQVNGRVFPVSGECAARMISTEKTQSTRPKQTSWKMSDA